jgi:hypothetical protein
MLCSVSCVQGQLLDNGADSAGSSRRGSLKDGRLHRPCDIILARDTPSDGRYGVIANNCTGFVVCRSQFEKSEMRLGVVDVVDDALLSLELH